MTQNERWLEKYNEVMKFIETNKRNPSKHSEVERGRYLNWLKHNKKLFNNGELRPERVEMFKKLMGLCELYKRKNQYE